MILAASSIHVTVGEVAAALALVAIAAIASRAWHAGLDREPGEKGRRRQQVGQETARVSKGIVGSAHCGEGNLIRIRA